MSLIDKIMQWDSSWFISIVNDGYMREAISNIPGMNGQANWAFFPLFPILVKLITLIGCQTSVAAIGLNSFIELFSLHLFYLLSLDYLNKKQAHHSVLLLAFSPVNIWFNSAYSDMLFFYLTLLAFYNLHRHNYWIVAIIGLLLACTRFVGIFIIASLIISYYRYKPLKVNNLIYLFLQCIIISIGLLGFMAYLAKLTGDPLAFYHVQSAWGHLNVNWIADITTALSVLWTSGNAISHFFLLIFPIGLIALLYLNLYEEAIFVALCLGAPIAAGTLWSFTRYFLTLFPFYISLAFFTSKNYLTEKITLILITFNYAVFFYLWISGSWQVN